MREIHFMRICIDIQSAILNPTGVGRYTLDLVKHLDNIIYPDELVLFQFNLAKHDLPFQITHSTRRIIRLLPGRVIRRAWRMVSKWPSFNFFAGPADVFHFPHFTIPPLKGGKSVVTIHDMSFLRFPEYAPTRYARYLSDTIQDTVNKADAILTDSLFSKQEIESLLNIDSSRLFPVYPGISSEFNKRDRESINALLSRLNIDRPYILLVATIEPRKNIPFLIDIFEKLERFDGYLVIAGKLGWKYETIINRMQTSSKANSIRYLEYVDDKDLPSLYSGAELFVFPSFYEGFGLPPLESMACGVPVVSSAGGSLYEALGEGACIIHDFDHDTWIENIQNLLFDSDIREKRINAGFRRVLNYTWHDSASQVLQIYKSLS